MSDIMSILQNNYLTVGQNTTATSSSSKYVPVNASDYQGTWSGQYGDGTKFSVQVLTVSGYHATVKYTSGSTTTFGDVMIKDSSFRVGDSKFVLQGQGTALVATAITDPISGDVSLSQGTATLAT